MIIQISEIKLRATNQSYMVLQNPIVWGLTQEMWKVFPEDMKWKTLLL